MEKIFGYTMAGIVMILVLLGIISICMFLFYDTQTQKFHFSTGIKHISAIAIVCMVAYFIGKCVLGGQV